MFLKLPPGRSNWDTENDLALSPDHLFDKSSLKSYKLQDNPSCGKIDAPTWEIDLSCMQILYLSRSSLSIVKSTKSALRYFHVLSKSEIQTFFDHLTNEMMFWKVLLLVDKSCSEGHLPLYLKRKKTVAWPSLLYRRPTSKASMISFSGESLAEQRPQRQRMSTGLGRCQIENWWRIHRRLSGPKGVEKSSIWGRKEGTGFFFTDETKKEWHY